jgi:hypothetical protein
VVRGSEVRTNVKAGGAPELVIGCRDWREEYEKSRVHRPAFVFQVTPFPARFSRIQSSTILGKSLDDSHLAKSLFPT